MKSRGKIYKDLSSSTLEGQVANSTSSNYYLFLCPIHHANFSLLSGPHGRQRVRRVYTAPPTSSSKEANDFDSAHAALHKAAACVSNRVSSPVGGTPFSPSNNWQTTYEVLADATKCACDMYKQRNTGGEMWDMCPDCTFVSLCCSKFDSSFG
jgi:hypothetical protein